MADRPRQISAAVVRLLRQARLNQKMSINQVAMRAGLSEQMIRYVEREMRNPTLDTVLRIAQALDVDLSKILKSASKSTSRSR